jgi:hypothetical protein
MALEAAGFAEGRAAKQGEQERRFGPAFAPLRRLLAAAGAPSAIIAEKRPDPALFCNHPHFPAPRICRWGGAMLSLGEIGFAGE